MQAMDEMYTSWRFGEEKMIDREGKTDAYKAWTSCKAYFKELYAKQNRYNKATEKKIGFESVMDVRKKNISLEYSIRDMFK